MTVEEYRKSKRSLTHEALGLRYVFYGEVHQVVLVDHYWIGNRRPRGAVRCAWCHRCAELSAYPHPEGWVPARAEYAAGDTIYCSRECFECFDDWMLGLRVQRALHQLDDRFDLGGC